MTWTLACVRPPSFVSSPSRPPSRYIVLRKTVEEPTRHMRDRLTESESDHQEGKWVVLEEMRRSGKSGLSVLCEEKVALDSRGVTLETRQGACCQSVGRKMKSVCEKLCC